MSVHRYDLEACIGCKNCVTVCPMDVFRFDNENMKSVIAYIDNCQSCGQCYLHCEGRSLRIVNTSVGYAITNYRAVSTATPSGVDEAIKAQPEKSAQEAAEKAAEKEAEKTGKAS